MRPRPEPGIELRPYQVILRPLVTEKGTHQSTRYNAYTFQVNPLATKTQIKAAVEELFNVRVEARPHADPQGQEAPLPPGDGPTPDVEEGRRHAQHAEDKIEFF